MSAHVDRAGIYEVQGLWYEVPRPIPFYRAVRGLLLNALAFTDGNQIRAAAALDISARQFNDMMRTHAIPRAKAPQVHPRRSR